MRSAKTSMATCWSATKPCGIASMAPTRTHSCMMSTMPRTVSVLTLRRPMSNIVNKSPTTRAAVPIKDSVFVNRSMSPPRCGCPACLFVFLEGSHHRVIDLMRVRQGLRLLLDIFVYHGLHLHPPSVALRVRQIDDFDAMLFRCLDGGVVRVFPQKTTKKKKEKTTNNKQLLDVGRQGLVPVLVDERVH